MILSNNTAPNLSGFPSVNQKVVKRTQLLAYGNLSHVAFGDTAPHASKEQIAQARKIWETGLAAQKTKSPEKPKVSVLIPIYNVEKYLKQTIESIQNQTYKKWEALLVNDGSSDSSLEIAKQYANTDPRIKVIDGPHTGIAAVFRNWMASKAKGKYISQMDSDDAFANPHVLKREVEYLKRNPNVNLVYASAKRIDVNGKQLPSPKHDGVLLGRVDR